MIETKENAAAEAAAPPMPAPKEEPPPPKKVWVAIFAEDGGLWGFHETVEGAEDAHGVVFDHLPDNICDGRYRWDHNLRRFEPRPDVVAEKGDTAIINQMIVQGIIGAVDRDTLPLGVQDQIKFIERTSPGTKAQLEAKYKHLVGVQAGRRHHRGR